METAHGLTIPRTLGEACDPRRMALLVYDMQVGIVSQVADGPTLVARTRELVAAARRGGFRVCYSRHTFLPSAVAGRSALRRALDWQRVDRVADLRPFLLPGSPEAAPVPELEPAPTELTVDKVTMSAFAGTPLDIVLRDCGIDAVAVAGIATEIGIVPTVTHALDLGYLPVVVTDACGHGNAEAAGKALDWLAHAGGVLFSDTATLAAAMDHPQGAP